MRRGGIFDVSFKLQQINEEGEEEEKEEEEGEDGEDGEEEEDLLIIFLESGFLLG